MKVEITEDKIKVLEINGIKIKEGVFIW
jgi:hypothetical protein